MRSMDENSNPLTQKISLLAEEMKRERPRVGCFKKPYRRLLPLFQKYISCHSYLGNLIEQSMVYEWFSRYSSTYRTTNPSIFPLVRLSVRASVPMIQWPSKCLWRKKKESRSQYWPLLKTLIVSLIIFNVQITHENWPMSRLHNSYASSIDSIDFCLERLRPVGICGL